VAAPSPGRRAPRNADARMSLVEHLRELRYRLGISAVAVILAMIVVFVLWQPVFDFLKQPYCHTAAGARQNCNLVALGIFDQFKVRLRVAAIGGGVLASPVWLYQIGAFITPALHRKEKRYAAAFLGASLVLFGVGAVLAYLTIAQGLDFLLRIGGDGVITLTSVQSYLSFVTLCLLAFGVAFEFPVVVMFLNLVGLFPVAVMRRWRRGMIVAIFAAAAVITPSQDPFTFVIMAVPICLLYEACIVVARVRERSAHRRRQAEGLTAVPDDVASPLDLPPERLDADV
jgi:sec-independent protein translocase protein TatC